MLDEKKLNETLKDCPEVLLNEKKLKETIEVCGELLADRSKFDEGEREYKLKIAANIRVALQAVKNGSDFRAPLTKAFGSPNNLTSWQAHDDFMHWAADNSDAARHALEPFNDTGLSIEERVNQFFKRLSESAVAGFNTRLMFASFFLFGSDPEHLVPYRYEAFKLAEQLLGWPQPGPDLPPGDTYWHHLCFVQKLEEELRAAGLDVRDTLDAQGLMWGLTKYDNPACRAWRGELNRLWWVNQGGSYTEERDGGFIHAPKANKAGRPFPHWTNVSRVQPGDLILHYAGKEIRAISRVEAAPESDARPVDHPDRPIGYLARTKYFELPEGIPLRNVPLEWRAEEGGPFNKNGNVNQGYLYPLSSDLRQRFMEHFSHLLPPDIFKDSHRCILKVAPGRNGQYWDECLQGGYICVGWDEIGDLGSYQSEAELRTALQEGGRTDHAGTLTQYARALWAYRNLVPGDLVVANQGLSHLLGVGTVVEPGYEYRPDRPYYRNVVHIQWDTSRAGPIAKQSPNWMNTIVPLSEEEYRKVLGPTVTPESSFDDLVTDLDARGFFFPAELVSNYLLALQAKHFVILTGISGTGKTQLALAVARHFHPAQEGSDWTAPPGAVEFTVQPSYAESGMVLPRRLVANLRMPEPRAGGTRKIRVSYPAGEAVLTLYHDAERKQTDLRFSGEFRSWFSDHLKPGDRFVLSIEQGDGNEEDALRLEYLEATSPHKPFDHYSIIAVRPDWTDNRGLLGYYNPLSERYTTTEFLRLLLDARQEEARAAAEHRQPHPFFVVLDEMNLARVEHYFSDFLSALESGEAIELHDSIRIEAGEGEDGVPVPRRLTVPRNLFFTGTVNVDETTFMFSPKVLDRAFTLELNEVSLEAYGAADASQGEYADSLVLTRLPGTLQLLPRPSRTDWDALAGLVDGEMRELLIELNELLADEGRHFGYRVANEIGRFVTLAADQAQPGDDPQWTAFDLAVLQKVLPKFHGTQQELEGVLRKLLAFVVRGQRVDAEEELAKVEEAWRLQRGHLVPVGTEASDPPSPRLPRTAAKVCRMLDRVRRQGFTAYVE